MKKLSAVLVAGLFALGACGDDEAPVAGEQPAADAPERIVSMSPSATETLFAIGAGDQVVAVDAQSDFPEGVPTTDLSAYEPNVEAIAAYDPDLVVMAEDPELEESLEALDIEVLVSPAPVELEDVYTEMARVGEASGHPEEAAELADEVRAEVEEIAANAEDRDPLTAYWELDPTYYSVTSATFIGKLMDLVGITSIADEAQSDVPDYPQLSPEHIVQSDPHLIVLADTECCEQDATTLAARPGWEGMRAITQGNVVEMSDDIASRWGPRIVDLLRQLDEAAAAVAA